MDNLNAGGFYSPESEPTASGYSSEPSIYKLIHSSYYLIKVEIIEKKIVQPNPTLAYRVIKVDILLSYK